MENESTMSTRRKFDMQFKEDAVNLLLRSGKGVRETAAELGIKKTNLSRWKIEHLKKLDGSTPAGGPAGMKPSDFEKENRDLRKELSYVKEQRDILKKAISIFSGDGSSRMSS